LDLIPRSVVFVHTSDGSGFDADTVSALDEVWWVDGVQGETLQVRYIYILVGRRRAG